MERRYWIGMGSNVGSRWAFLEGARAALAAHPEVVVEATAHPVLSAPLGPPQAPYLNGGLRLRSALRPEAMLGALQAIEDAFGRARRIRWGPRTLDLDLLMAEGHAQSTPTLTLPHPELERRSFVLAPLGDLDAPLRDRLPGLLEALGGPPPRAAAPRVEEGQDTMRVEALDDLDAAALALGALLGARSWTSRRARVHRASTLAELAASLIDQGAAPGALGLRRDPNGEVEARVLGEGPWSQRPRGVELDVDASTVTAKLLL
jgi:2-amino-4-hydroxy-6-hydroxymethyldihydropteridine diphosphokinase